MRSPFNQDYNPTVARAWSLMWSSREIVVLGLPKEVPLPSFPLEDDVQAILEDAVSFMAEVDASLGIG